MIFVYLIMPYALSVSWVFQVHGLFKGPLRGSMHLFISASEAFIGANLIFLEFNC